MMSMEVNFVLFPKSDTGPGATKKNNYFIFTNCDECHAALLSLTV